MPCTAPHNLRSAGHQSPSRWTQSRHLSGPPLGGPHLGGADTPSVRLGPEIAHFAVSMYFSCPSAYQPSLEHLHSLHSAALSHALLCSLVLCHTPSHSAMLCRTSPGHFPTLHPMPPGIPCTPHTTFLLSYHLYPCSWTLRTLSI
jgi:hypothetical protein